MIDRLKQVLFFLLFLFIGCSEDDTVQSKSFHKIVVDEFSAIANVQYRGSDKQTKFDYLIRYHYLNSCGSIEKVTFTVNNYINTTHYRQYEPTPIGMIETKDYWFWIADTLAGIDSVTLTCTMTGTFYSQFTCSNIIDSLKWTDSIVVAIHRQ